jgi:hypothetical protein
MRTLLATLAAIALCGCTTTTQYSYPDGFKDFFSASRKSAVAAIASVDGKQPKLNERCRYETKAGTRKYSGMWCWQSPEWGMMWVAGLCYLTNPMRVVIGCNPANGGELHAGVAQHECGHQALWDDRRDNTHNAKYRGALWGWTGPDSRMVRQTRLGADGTLVIVDGFPPEGE